MVMLLVTCWDTAYTAAIVQMAAVSARRSLEHVKNDLQNTNIYKYHD